MNITKRFTAAVIFASDKPIREAVIEAVKARTDLYGANLSGANLSRANLSEANLSRADLSGANLSGADLSRANLSWANLSRADLSGANLSEANLYGANLFEANLFRVNLSRANLSRADLYKANLSRANLSGANLSGANLSGADLSRANLSWANLSWANLSGANLSWANLSGAENIPLTAISATNHVPESGPFFGWKKCQNNTLVQVAIGTEARRSNATGRKCRAEYVKVLQVLNRQGQPIPEATSTHDSTVKYRVGEIVRCDKWEENRWIECGGGIHFFLTRAEAEAY